VCRASSYSITSSRRFESCSANSRSFDTVEDVSGRGYVHPFTGVAQVRPWQSGHLRERSRKATQSEPASVVVERRIAFEGVASRKAGGVSWAQTIGQTKQACNELSPDGTGLGVPVSDNGTSEVGEIVGEGSSSRNKARGVSVRSNVSCVSIGSSRS